MVSLSFQNIMKNLKKKKESLKKNSKNYMKKTKSIEL